MKFKLSKRYYINICLVVALISALIFTFTSSFYMQKLSGNVKITEETIVKVNKSKEKSSIIKTYIEDHQDTFVDEIDINKEVASIIMSENDRYQTKLFDYESGEELDINTLIKKQEKENFYNKIKELLYLKYPTFIADVLNTDNGQKVYVLGESELIIYYYDFVIDPMPKETLFLKVNYNEIKDYLDITVSLDSTYENENGNIIDPNKKLIAITFDDGPGSYTSNLVDILTSNKATVTFFMLGKNLNYFKDTVKKVHDSGMEIGYHSYAHTNFKRQEISTILEEWNTSNQILQSITGDTFHLIRPPYGAINADIKTALDAPIIMWHVDTEDWRHKDVEYLKKYVLEHANDGDIILFHDIHKTSVEAIKELLPILYTEGYQVVTVSKLAEIKGTTLENHQVYRYFTR